MCCLPLPLLLGPLSSPPQLSEACCLQGLILCLAHSKRNDFLFLSELQALKQGTACPILRAQSACTAPLSKAGSASSEGRRETPFRLMERKSLSWEDWGWGDSGARSPGPGKIHSLSVPRVVCIAHPALGRPRHVDLCRLQASLGYEVTSRPA